MFERLKKVFASSAAQPEVSRVSPVSDWASAHGFSYSAPPASRGLTLGGKIRGKPWKLESGAASRDYICGEELYARADLGIDRDIAALIMSRPLKETLEKRAYAIYTDALQTTANPGLPEEMRWLAIFEECGWRGLVPDFWQRYTVLADRRAHALAWIDSRLAELLLRWPQPGVSAQTPFILVLLRGKAFLRMQYTSGDIATLQHAAIIFTVACEAALAGAESDISL